MNKELLKKIIIEYQELIAGVKITRRNYKVEKTANYIIVGPRRSGKTYFMYQIIQELIKKTNDNHQFLYINFEDERLMELKSNDLNTVIEAYRELYLNQPVLFFDEIQNIVGWEKFIGRLADQKYLVYITGSNAKLISREMASILGGRFMILKMSTLSFREYLFFNGLKPREKYEYSEQRFQVISFFSEYLRSGAFPETLHLDNMKAYLRNLFQKVFYGDIMTRYNIRNEQGLKLLIKKIAESIADETSFNRIRNLIKSSGIDIGTATLIEYFGYFEEGFLIYNLLNFALKFAERESKRKFYFVDNGFLNLFLFDSDDKLLENLVYLELNRRYKEDIYYFRDKYEIDFYIPSQKVAIQVAYSVYRPEIIDRETLALSNLFKPLNLERGIILTYNDEPEIPGNTIGIKIIPTWKWLLREE